MRGTIQMSSQWNFQESNEALRPAAAADPLRILQLVPAAVQLQWHSSAHSSAPAMFRPPCFRPTCESL